MSRRISCHCNDPSLEEVKSGGGELMGYLCLKCMLPSGMKCAVCKRSFRDVTEHWKATKEKGCGFHARKRRFWGSNYFEEEYAATDVKPSNTGDPRPPGTNRATGCPEPDLLWDDDA